MKIQNPEKIKTVILDEIILKIKLYEMSDKQKYFFNGIIIQYKPKKF